MKKLAIVLALGAAVVSAPAFAAGEVSGDVKVTGTVASKCMMTTTNGLIEIGELADSNGAINSAAADGKSATLVGWCNKANSTMSVTATQLTHKTLATVADGFVRQVNFTAQAVAKSALGATVGTATDTNATDATAGTPATVGMFKGDIVVSLSNLATDTGLLAAGDYEGNIKVTLAPAA